MNWQLLIISAVSNFYDIISSLSSFFYDFFFSLHWIRKSQSRKSRPFYDYVRVTGEFHFLTWMRSVKLRDLWYFSPSRCPTWNIPVLFIWKQSAVINWLTSCQSRKSTCPLDKPAFIITFFFKNYFKLSLLQSWSCNWSSLHCFYCWVTAWAIYSLQI